MKKEKERDDKGVLIVQEWSTIDPGEGSSGAGSEPSGNVVGESSSEMMSVAVESNEEELEESGVATSLEAVNSEGEELEQVVSAAKDIGPVAVGKDREKFREAVKVDDSLKEWKELGDRGERGFRWKDGVLLRGVGSVRGCQTFFVFPVRQEFQGHHGPQRVDVPSHRQTGKQASLQLGAQVDRVRLRHCVQSRESERGG